MEPHTDRPRMFGSTTEAEPLPWAWALDRLHRAPAYWIATTLADGRPHTRPVWGVVIDELVYFSTGSRAAWNLARSPEISLHLESSTEVVILEGVATIEQHRATIARVCEDYSAKYQEAIDPDHLPGPFYAVHPRVAFGWIAVNDFVDRAATFKSLATRWTFDGTPP